jgi:hypothetical protein
MMRKFIQTIMVMVSLVLIIPQNTLAQRKKNEPAKPAEATPAPAPEKKGGIQPFDKVITSKAVSDEGLFNVHNVEGKFYYEIPDSLFGREMLLNTRIAKTAEGIGYGGEKL